MVDDVQQIIDRCYKKYLNRDPDPSGIETYTKYLQKRKEIDLIRILKSSEEYDQRIKSKKWINVFMCVRNNSLDLQDTFDTLEFIRRKNDTYDFRYYIFENDSDDDTVSMCKVFMSKNHGVFKSCVLKTKKWEDVKDKDRVTDMAYYRNQCKELCYLDDRNCEYCVLIDTKVKFNTDIFDKYIHHLNNTSSTVMITPYGKVGKKNVYYDTYALDSPNPIKINTGIQKVNSACAGIFMVRSIPFFQCSWKMICGNKSEHNNFCYELKKYGDIVVDTNIHVEWTK